MYVVGWKLRLALALRLQLATGKFNRPDREGSRPYRIVQGLEPAARA